MNEPANQLIVEKTAGGTVVRVRCKRCGELLYDDRRRDSGHAGLLRTAIEAHMEFAHALAVGPLDL